MMARLTATRSAAYARLRLRTLRADPDERAELEEAFHVRSAADVAEQLGEMKGVMAKMGQMVSVIGEVLPDEAQEALASLQTDMAPMAPGLAEAIVEEELGASPASLFRSWDPESIAAASIGQVHRVVLHDGRDAAVKVQYPGVGEAMASDLANADVLYGLVTSFALKGLDPKALVDELRTRMVDELDYRIEAREQRAFADRYRGHPFIHVPDVVQELSSERVLTTEWAPGMSWQKFEATASPEARQKAGEVLFRFAQGGIYGHRVFNGDPHPGNYLFNADGSMSFLDFGFVKRWEPGELEALLPLIDPLLNAELDELLTTMVSTGFIAADHTCDPQAVWHYVSRPYVPYLEDEFTFSREFVADTINSIIDVRGPHRDVVEVLNIPPAFVVLDRVVWGVSALLGRLGARNRWRGILDEYRVGGPPATPLGELEAAWADQR
jgi:predicted unusual protein kinase regulating ubiquinone biosynthesis (AarF/ABC1/UbiB family)